MRIAHYLARAGIASRRQAEELVIQGRVTLNGKTVEEVGTKVDPATDKICFDKKPVILVETHVTLVMNKPAMVMVTRDDPQERQTVYDLLPNEYAAQKSRLVYAGRLDYQTRGMLIMTTDGDLVNRLTHPSHVVEKTYEVVTTRPLSPQDLRELAAGVTLEDGPTSPARVRSLPERNGYELVIHEGRNRQIRRMIEAVRARVVSLRRTAVGAIRLVDLRLHQGGVVALSPAQIDLLFKPAIGKSAPDMDL